MNKENATYVDGTFFNTLDEAVKFLENCRTNEQNVYVKFNGHNLYSSNVTLDSAYMQVLGLTKAEDEAISREVASAHSLEERTEAINKWNLIVNHHKQQAKQTATLINNEHITTIDEAVKYLDACNKDGQNVYLEFNGHKLYSTDISLDKAYMQVLGLTKAEDEAISKEIDKATTPEERKAAMDKWTATIAQHQQEAKETATPAKENYFNTLDEAVEYLDNCKKEGQNVYLDFNGHKLYSTDISLNSAYLEVTGLTKEQTDAMDKEVFEASSPEERRNIIQKWENIKSQPNSKQDVLKSAIEATEQTTTKSSIDEQEQAIDELNLDKKERIEEMEKN